MLVYFFFCTLVLRVLYNVQFCFLFELSWRQWLLNAFRGSRETLALHLIQMLVGSRELHLHSAIRVVVVPGQPAYNRLSRGKGEGGSVLLQKRSIIHFAPHSWEFRSTKHGKPYPLHHAFSPPNPSLESLLYVGIEARMFIQPSWEVNVDLVEANYLLGKVHGCPLVISHSIHALYSVTKSNPSLLKGTSGKQQELSTGCL